MKPIEPTIKQIKQDIENNLKGYIGGRNTMSNRKKIMRDIIQSFESVPYHDIKVRTLFSEWVWYKQLWFHISWVLGLRENLFGVMDPRLVLNTTIIRTRVVKELSIDLIVTPEGVEFKEQ